MKSTIKRFTACFLALITLLSAFAACADTGKEEPITTEPLSTEAPVQVETTVEETEPAPKVYLTVNTMPRENEYELLRKYFPDCEITTDIIVGFPTETEEMFKRTIQTCRELELTKMHVFPFSLRQGTKAETLPNHIETEVKKERARRLLAVSKELELSYYNKYLNKEVEVLIEETKEGYSYGHTGNYLYVKINKELEHNTFVKVTIKDIEYPYCIAE